MLISRFYHKRMHQKNSNFILVSHFCVRENFQGHDKESDKKGKGTQSYSMKTSQCNLIKKQSIDLCH